MITAARDVRIRRVVEKGSGAIKTGLVAGCAGKKRKLSSCISGDEAVPANSFWFSLEIAEDSDACGFARIFELTKKINMPIRNIECLIFERNDFKTINATLFERLQ